MLSPCPLTWRCSSWHPHCWPLSSFGGGMGLVPAVWHGKGAVLGGWQYHHLAQCSPAGRPQHIILLGERHYWEGLSWCCPTRSVSGNVTISTKGHEEETPEDIHFHWLLGSSQWLSLVGTMTKENLSEVPFVWKKVSDSHVPIVVIRVSAYICQQIPEAHGNIANCLFKLHACSKVPPLSTKQNYPPETPYPLAECAHIRPKGNRTHW